MKSTLLPQIGRDGARPRKRRGQAIIEMALVMVVLLTLSFGVVDFGLFLTGYIRASNCAREAARTAIVRDTVGTDFCSSGHQLVPLFESAPVSMDPTNYKCQDRGTPVTATVTATYRWKAIAGVVNTFFPGTPWAETQATITKATMRMDGDKTC